MNRNDQPFPPWLWPNLLGLDAPAVAVAWQWLFARVFGADLPAVFHLILGLSVWCVYLADRLYDARRSAEGGGQTDRLRFAKRHFASLSAITVVASVANLFLIIRHVPRPLIFENRLSQRTLRVLADTVLLAPLLFIGFS